MEDKGAKDEMATIWHMFAGAMARSTCGFIMMPVDTIKTRLQFQGASDSVIKYSSFWDALKRIIKEEGILSLWRGVTIKLLYKCPAGAISFGCYELFKKLIHNPKESLKNYNKPTVDNPFLPLAIGTVARVVGTASRTPFDIIKQRLQIQGSLKHKKISGVVTVGKNLIVNEGIKGLWYIDWLYRDFIKRYAIWDIIFCNI